jgi:serine/threonine protein kinase
LVGDEGGGNEVAQPGSSTQSARYRVLETLGQGGMGVVYRVHDLVHERELAQKRLNDIEDTRATAPQNSRLRAHAIASFRREYHTLAQLAHPNTTINSLS